MLALVILVVQARNPRRKAGQGGRETNTAKVRGGQWHCAL